MYTLSSAGAGPVYTRAANRVRLQHVNRGVLWTEYHLADSALPGRLS